jgi:hypothetical protein
LIESQRASGLSIAEFCRRKDVSQASFFQWRKKLRESSPENGTFASADSPGRRPAAFVPLSVIDGNGVSGGVEVQLPCGAVVRLPAGDKQSLRQVVLLLMAAEECEA